MGLFSFIFIAAFVGGIIGGIVKISNNNKHKKQAQGIFDNLTEFKADSYYLSQNSGLSVGFDNTAKKICFLDRTNVPYTFGYNKILQCELIVDGETVSKQSTTATIGRSMLGGILSGGVGAIIGGTTAAKTSSMKVSSIDLKIILNDTQNPLYRINFLSTNTSKGSLLYKVAYNEAEKWNAIVVGLIRQGNSESNEGPSAKTMAIEMPNLSIADELKKLKELLDAGVLTADEFNKQKAKLIG